jgi:hypothetical protein
MSTPISEGSLSAQRILRALDVMWLRWALRKLDPTHREVPFVIQQLNARRPL